MTIQSQKAVEESSGPEIGSQEWVKDWMKERKAKRVSKAAALKDLGAYLKDLGYKYIRVWYEGAGDSGECFEAEGWKEKIDLTKHDDDATWPDVYQSKPWNHDKKEDFDEWKGMTRNQKELEEQYKLFRDNHPDNQLQSELHYELVELVDYDWYNNEGGQGEMVWDLEKEEFCCNGEQNIYACNKVKETYFMDGRQPETEYNSEIYER